MKTVTVLTFELPIDLAERLRRAGLESHGMSLQDVTLAALQEWLDRHEGTDDRRAGAGDRRSEAGDRRWEDGDRRR